jgi:hypothetical protein
MAERKTLSGRCLCGSVTFVVSGAKPGFHACHCAMCRRWSSAPFFGVNVRKIEFNGEEHVKRYQSSDWAERGFCTRCGSNLFYYMKALDHYSVAMGSFDDASAFELTTQYYIDKKPDGYAFLGDLESLTEAEIIAKYSS